LVAVTVITIYGRRSNLTKQRLHAQIVMKNIISTIFFYAITLFHVVLASTSAIYPKETGLLRFKITFFTQFNLGNFLLALILLIIQIIVSYIFVIRRFSKSGLIPITKDGLISKKDKKVIATMRIDPKQIFEWVQELADKQNIKSIRRVYLSDTSIPNAMTLDIVPLPIIRCSWLVLDANVLEILDEREIKAVIAHELGHVKHLDGIMNLTQFGVNYFVFIAYSLIILEILYYTIATQPVIFLNIFLRVGFLIAVILILTGFTILSRILMNFSRRQSELLADYYAAKHVGRNHMINALVLLGQRMDAVVAFGKEYKWLGRREGKQSVDREFMQGIKSLPAEELSKQISREKAVRIYIKQRLESLQEDLKIPFEEKEIDHLTERASKNLIEIREEAVQNGLAKDRKRDKEIQKETINWLKADKDKDLYLKEAEINELIKEIKRQPKKELFEQDLYHQRKIIGYDHPSMKQRLLFLYDSLPSNSL
jgi:Zn-dependent protease with chaperone function